MALIQYVIILFSGYLCQKGLASQLTNNVVRETSVCHAAGKNEPEIILKCENGLINVKKVTYGFKSQKIIENQDVCHFDTQNVCWERSSRMHTVDYSSTSTLKQSFMNIQLKKSGTFSAKPIKCSNDIEVNSVEITYQCLPSESITCMGKCNLNNEQEMFTTDVGYIKSPNYPLLYPSSHMSSCHLKATEAGSTIFLHTEDFQLEDSDLCFRDTLKLYGHRRVQETDYCGKITGGGPLIVTEGELTVEFSSDDFVNARGFLLKFWAMKPNFKKVPVKTICKDSSDTTNSVKSDTNSAKTDTKDLIMDDEKNNIKVMPMNVGNESAIVSIIGSVACAVIIVVIVIAVVMRVLRKQNKINSNNMRKGPIMSLPGEESGIYIIQRGAKIGDQSKQYMRTNVI